MSRRQNRASKAFRNLGLERLESRVVLDGGIQAVVRGGSLRIIGDSNDNEILIEQTARRQFIVSSRDGTTLINGQSGPRTFTNVRDDLRISMRGGEDVVEILGTADDAVMVSDRLFIDTGLGADQVLLTEVHAIGLHILTGPQGDIVNFGNDGAEGGVLVTKEAVILTDTGADSASIANSLFKRTLVLNMGPNNDETEVQSSIFRKKGTFIGGSGTDVISRESNRGKVRITGYETSNNTVDNPAPIAPVAANDTASVIRGGNVSINVATNDTAPASTLNLGSIVITQQPTNGSVAVNTNGTVTYTNNGANVATDSFRYTIKNQEGTTSNEATVSITVNAQTVTANADAASVIRSGNVAVNVATNDTTNLGSIDPASIVITQQPAGGSVTVNTNGTVTYTNTTATASDSFQYTIKNQAGTTSNPATVSITVNAQTVTANNDTGNVVQGGNVAVNVATNDTTNLGTIDPASIIITQQPTNGTAVANANGTVTYTNTSAATTDTFRYTIKNQSGTVSNEATVTMTVAAQTVTANPDTGSVARNGNVDIDVATNDTTNLGAIDSASIVITQQPTIGTATPNANGTVTYTNTGGTATSDTFQYTIKNQAGTTSNATTVNVTIT